MKKAFLVFIILIMMFGVTRAKMDLGVRDEQQIITQTAEIKEDSRAKLQQSKEFIAIKSEEKDSLNNEEVDIQVLKQINVQELGICGDGITDNTNKIKELFINYAGKEIFFPKGTYVISDKINVYSNTVIKGEGVETEFLAIEGKESGTEIFQIYAEDNIKIEGICISGNSAVNNGEQYSVKDGIHLLDIWDAQGIEIVNCSFRDNVYCGIRIFGVENIMIKDSSFYNVDCGVIALGKSNILNFIVRDCIFSGHNRSEAISLYGTGTYTNISIINNVINNKTDGHGIWVNGKSINKNVWIKNNTITNCAVGISVFNSDNGEISGNIINGTTSGRGMEIYGCTNVNIFINEIRDTNYDGLSIKNCGGCDFFSNTILITNNAKNKDMAGIKILNECIGINIFNNVIKQESESANKYSIIVKAQGEIVLEENILNDLPIFISKESDGISYSSLD